MNRFRNRRTVLRYSCGIASKVTPEVDAEIEAICDQQNCTRAEAIRQLIDVALKMKSIVVEGERR